MLNNSNVTPKNKDNRRIQYLGLIMVIVLLVLIGSGFTILLLLISQPNLYQQWFGSSLAYQNNLVAIDYTPIPTNTSTTTPTATATWPPTYTPLPPTTTPTPSATPTLTPILPTATPYNTPATEIIKLSQHPAADDKGGNLLQMGEGHRQQGNYPEALKQYQAALAVFQQNDHLIGQAHAWLSIGLVLRLQNDWLGTIRSYKKALPLLRQLGETTAQAETWCEISRIYEAQGDMSEALAKRNYVLIEFRVVCP